MADVRRETVLIVEDDPGVARLEERRLSRAGYDVVTALSALEAVTVIRRGGIDLIVLDQKLPGGTDGLDFYARLEAEHQWHIPAILVTGLNDEHTLLRAIRAGLRDFVPKSPDFLDDLPPIVDRVMRQVRVERRLAESESRLATIIASALDAVISTDGAGSITLFNPAAEWLFGVPVAEALEQPIDRFVADLPREGPGHRTECRGLCAGGASRPLEVSATRTEEVGGQVIHTLFLRDLTSQKQAEAERAELIRSEAARLEAEAANQAKDRFLAMLSHELRTPMNPVLMAAGDALEDPDTPPRLHNLLAMILRNVRLQARLIDDLLDVTRIAQGKLELRREVLDIHTLIHQTLEICRPDIHDAGLQLDIDFQATESRVEVDAARLQQIFWNLIKNAVKFTGPGGRITLRTRNLEPMDGDVGSSIVVSVSDTGIGISPELMPKIFEPFEQGSARTTRLYGGLGLGLAISHSVAEAHGGELAVSSAGRGQGATFTLRLGTAAPHRLEGAVTPHLMETCTSIREILLVEDDPDSSRVVCRMLQRRGYHVTTAETLAEACQAVRNQPFDLVISDIRLPDGTGHELIRRLREIRPVRGIVLSGVGRDQDVELSLASGFLAHLIKPIDARVLVDSIQRAAAIPV